MTALAACHKEPAKVTTNPFDETVSAIVAQIQTPKLSDRQWVFQDEADDNGWHLQKLQAVIDSCAAQGGGTVSVKAGLYRLNGTLWLRSRVNLHLEADAVLQFSGRGDDFLPVVPTRWEGTDLMGRSAMIYANNAEDIAITGQGTIDAQGSLEMAAWGMVPGENDFTENIHGTHGETVEMDDVRRLREIGTPSDTAVFVPLADRVFGKGTFLRPCAIEFYNCRRILVEGITLKDSPFWCIHPLYSQHITVRDVTIRSHNPNNDGCDPESSSEVLIERCTFQTGDDAIAIKSGRDLDGRRVGRASHNIVIRNCLFQSECNGLCIGSEMSGGVHHVYVDSVRIGQVKNGLLFKSNKDRGGYIRNVWVRNIELQEAQGAVLRFENNYFGYRGGQSPAQYEDFRIAQVHARKAQAYAIYFDGLEELPMRDIKVRDFEVDSATHAYYLFHVDDYRFENCRVNGDTLPERPALSEVRQMCDVW